MAPALTSEAVAGPPPVVYKLPLSPPPSDHSPLSVTSRDCDSPERLVFSPTAAGGGGQAGFVGGGAAHHRVRTGSGPPLKYHPLAYHNNNHIGSSRVLGVVGACTKQGATRLEATLPGAGTDTTNLAWSSEDEESPPDDHHVRRPLLVTHGVAEKETPPPVPPAGTLSPPSSAGTEPDTWCDTHADSVLIATTATTTTTTTTTFTAAVTCSSSSVGIAASAQGTIQSTPVLPVCDVVGASTKEALSEGGAKMGDAASDQRLESNTSSGSDSATKRGSTPVTSGELITTLAVLPTKNKTMCGGGGTSVTTSSRGGNDQLLVEEHLHTPLVSSPRMAVSPNTTFSLASTSTANTCVNGLMTSNTSTALSSPAAAKLTPLTHSTPPGPRTAITTSPSRHHATATSTTTTTQNSHHHPAAHHQVPHAPPPTSVYDSGTDIDIGSFVSAASSHVPVEDLFGKDGVLEEELLKDRTEELLARQTDIEDKLRSVTARLSRMHVAALNKHVRRELTSFLHAQREMLRRSRDPAAAQISADFRTELLHTDAVKALSTTALVHLVKSLGGGTADAVVAGGDVLADPAAAAVSLPDKDVCKGVTRVACQLTGALSLAGDLHDPDTVADHGSSGCDSADDDYDDVTLAQPASKTAAASTASGAAPTRRTHRLPVSRSAAWWWYKRRGQISARWTWLQAQVSDLEYRIRVTSSQLRERRPRAHNPSTASTTTSVGGFTQDQLENSSARTRGHHPVRKHKYYKTSSIQALLSRESRLSSVRCHCSPHAVPGVAPLLVGLLPPARPRERQLQHQRHRPAAPRRPGLLAPLAAAPVQGDTHSEVARE